MRIQLQQLSVPLGYDDTVLRQRVSRKIGCASAQLGAIRVIRRSLDARPRNPEPVYVLTVEADLTLDALPHGARLPSLTILPTEPQAPAQPATLSRSIEPRPVVVGAGPSGLMAAYSLAMAGARPILIERGDDARTRAANVARYWQDGTLDPESNVLYGEGGAGLFSDGKLTARSKERGRIGEFMRVLHMCGADESVMIDAEPHLGSDVLLAVVQRLRERIVAAGGEVRFRARLESVTIRDGRIRALTVNGQELACDRCVLAVGHSARDVYDMLAARGVALAAKPFAVGVRLELPQAAIDRAQYGRFAGSPLLGAASFRLTRREERGVRACYSFCMCPGGKVIRCASEPGHFTTNGMSYSKRSLPNGNAAFIVPVGPADYPAHAVPALAGVAFQRLLESKASALAPGAAVPAVRLTDFLGRRVSRTLPDGCSCPPAAGIEFRDILPAYVTRTLESALPAMLKELNGARLDDAVLYAPETRSSSPLWIERSPDGESISARGLFPVGEGAGYAGGIVSSAVDGMRAAESILATP